MHGLALTLAAPREPRGHGFGEALGLHVGTNLEETIRNGKRVIELGFPGKVAHTEIIEPVEWARASLDTHDDFDAQFASEHEASITRGDWHKGTPGRKFLAAAESAN